MQNFSIYFRSFNFKQIPYHKTTQAIQKQTLSKLFHIPIIIIQGNIENIQKILTISMKSKKFQGNLKKFQEIFFYHVKFQRNIENFQEIFFYHVKFQGNIENFKEILKISRKSQ